MSFCEVCGKPIYTIGYRDFPPKLCRTTPNMLPGTSCKAVYRARQRNGHDPYPMGLVKILRTIPGGALIDDDGVVPPIIRESY